jgi:hypothetical protein
MSIEGYASSSTTSFLHISRWFLRGKESGKESAEQRNVVASCECDCP